MYVAASVSALSTKSNEVAVTEPATTDAKRFKPPAGARTVSTTLAGVLPKDAYDTVPLLTPDPSA